MPSYAAPTGEQVMARTGLNRLVTDDATDEAFITYLEDELVPQAEMLAALSVGETTFDSGSLTSRQAAALTFAVAYRTAALWLRYAATQKVTGTHEPLLMEDTDEIIAAAEAMEKSAESLESLAGSGVASSEDAPFAGFSASSSGFTRESDDRSPSEKNLLTDERDDIASSDLDNG